MDKMQMAHEYLLKYTGATVADAWAYADAMQAEAEKRKPSGLPDVLKEEWQPDWSQAPDHAIGWDINKRGQAEWISSDGGFYLAPSFGYTGNWKDSLRWRPE